MPDDHARRLHCALRACRGTRCSRSRSMSTCRQSPRRRSAPSWCSRRMERNCCATSSSMTSDVRSATATSGTFDGCSTCCITSWPAIPRRGRKVHAGARRCEPQRVAGAPPPQAGPSRGATTLAGPEKARGALTYDMTEMMWGMGFGGCSSLSSPFSRSRRSSSTCSSADWTRLSSGLQSSRSRPMTCRRW